MKRKILAVLLSAAMVCTSADVRVFAAEGIVDVKESEIQETAYELVVDEEEQESSKIQEEFFVEQSEQFVPETTETYTTATESLSEGQTDIWTEVESEIESKVESVTESESETEEEGNDVVFVETTSEIEKTEDASEINTVVDENGLEEKKLLATEEVIAQGKENNFIWKIDLDGKLIIEGTGDYFTPTFPANTPASAPWYAYRDQIKTAEVQVEGMTDTSYMFEDCSNLVTIDFSGFHSDKLYRTGGMFEGCSSLESLDLSNFQTEHVIDMSSMFKDCNNLLNLNISSFQTGKVTDMSNMFYGCSSLTSLDLDSFQLDCVVNMAYMFLSCEKLSDLSFGRADDANVTNMQGVFENCCSLTSLNLENFRAENVFDMSRMFANCSSLTNLNLNSFQTGKVTDMNCMFANCSSLTNLNLSSFQTGKVTDMSRMFERCNNLESLDLSSFQTDKVLSMSMMFNNCNKLYELKMDNFNTKNVTEMDYMFNNCTNLTNLDLEGFHTSNVTTMRVMFAGCSNLQSLNIGCFDTGSVTDIYWMFDGCNSLQELDMSRFDLGSLSEKATYIGTCNKLKKIYAPCNLRIEIPLDNISGDYMDKWFQNGTEIVEFPRKLQQSVILTKGQGQSVEAHITAVKQKTVYECGEALELDDLIVQYYGTDGTVKYVTGYTTDQENIDMSLAGIKYLHITYNDGSNIMTTAVKLTLYEKKTDDQPSSEQDKDDSSYTEAERIMLGNAGSIAPIKAKVYDGKPYEPSVKVFLNEAGKKVTLTEGTDYRVLYRNNINKGTGEVIVRGNGIYTGELRQSFVVLPKPMKKLKIVTGSMSVGSASMPPVYVYDGTKLLKKDKDYKLSFDSSLTAQKSTAAKVTVTAAEEGNYTGSVIAKLNIYENDASLIINPENVILTKREVIYTGKAVKVNPIVVMNDTLLIPNKEYKIQYQNNKNAGTAFAIITGKGKYKGKVVKSFQITAAKTTFTINQIPDKTYNGKLQKPTVIVRDGKKKLVKNKDYTIQYQDNLHAGSAKVIVTGKGNYAGIEQTVCFFINPQKISKVSVKGTSENLVLYYGRRKLKEEADYEKPVYDDASLKNKKIKVNITGKGDFTGMVTKTVKIQ